MAKGTKDTADKSKEDDPEKQRVYMNKFCQWKVDAKVEFDFKMLNYSLHIILNL